MCNNKAYVSTLVLSLLLFLCFIQSSDGSAMQLSSPDFAPDSRIPTRFTCSGDDRSPALTWTGTPSSTESFALIVKDPDAPSGNFVHWVILDIPPSITSFSEGVPPNPKTAFGAIQGQNSRGDVGYTGPCPPPGKDHHYHFRLYALDRNLGLSSDAGADQVEAAMRGHVVGETELVGVFSR
jgi:Raf kinase inhibitor-like YbhB/YbcL family protein